MPDTLSDLRRILTENKTIAVVGLSADWNRPSYFAAKYMQGHGYRVVPVNPRYAAHAEFGTEEKDEIIPAIKLAKSLGINADGPLPCDTSFITAFKNKNHDCIVGMYHDALQSGLKAFGFDRTASFVGFREP